PAGRWQPEPGGGGRGGLLHLDAGTDRHVPALLRPRGWRGHSHRLDHAVALSPSIATQWSGNYLDIIGDSLLTGPVQVLTEQPELVAQVEPTLVGHARLDPDRLAVLARTVATCLDPD